MAAMGLCVEVPVADGLAASRLAGQDPATTKAFGLWLVAAGCASGLCSIIESLLPWAQRGQAAAREAFFELQRGWATTICAAVLDPAFLGWRVNG
jgi:hypothetical protein